jgi:hypothetical protein
MKVYSIVKTTTDYANIEADKDSDLSALYSEGCIDEVCADAPMKTIKYSVINSDGKIVFETEI